MNKGYGQRLLASINNTDVWATLLSTHNRAMAEKNTEWREVHDMTNREKGNDQTSIIKN